MAKPQTSTSNLLKWLNSQVSILTTSIATKVTGNVAITGATKTKITYDTKGLVTAGADATTSDIGEGSNLYYTDARVKTALNATGDAGIYAARAWVNFNGTGTVAIRGSGNVSSITDHNTGDYTVNFTSAMPDANFCAQVTIGGTANAYLIRHADDTTARTVSTYRFKCNSIAAGNAAIDPANVDVVIFR